MKKKLKSFTKKFIIVFIIFAILFVLLNVLQLFKGSPINDIITSEKVNDTDLFPLMIKSEQIIDIYNMGSGISVLTKSSLINFSESGKREAKITHGYTNPVVQEGTKRLLTYDRGGSSFRVDTTTSSIGEIKITGQIISAQIASNGTIAVLSTDERYACVITVYNNTLQETYKYQSTDRMNDLCFAPDNKHIFASSIISQAGIVGTNLYELNLTTEDDAVKYTIPNLLPLSVHYSSNNNISVIGKDCVATLNTKSKETTRFEYLGNIQYFVKSSLNETVIVTKNLFNHYSTINVLNPAGVPIGSFNIDEEVVDIYSDGSRILVLTKESAMNFDMKLTLLNTIPLEKNAIKIGYNGNQVYILGVDSVDKYKID